jgi:DNA-binding NtrC family response regulator
MVERVRPGVLVVDGDAGHRRRIAALLGEAGIGVTAVADGAAALAAMSRDRFDLAVIGAGLMGAEGAVLSARLGRLALEIGPQDDGEPRRFVGRVRDRLLDAEEFDGNAAESCIAAAKLACLDQRQSAARAAGATELVESLAREIAETVALRQTLH